MKEFNDAHIAYKVGGGSHSFSMMQSLNAKLMAGFEMYYIVNDFFLYSLASLKRHTFLLWNKFQS